MNKNLLSIYLIVCLLTTFGLSEEIYAQEEKFKDSSQLKLAKPSSIIDRPSFNKGHITNSFQLLQAQNPSILISRGGNDPNGQVDIQIRGLQSFGISEPLIVLDGIPVQNLDGVHPNDVRSAKVIKSGAALARYGIRASGGVLEVNTESGIGEGTRINYRSYFAAENLLNKPKVFDAKTYRQKKETYNYGAETDWWEEIAQTGNSQNHYLSLSSGNKNSSYYASINYDRVNGVIKRTDFNRTNGRFSFEQKAMNEKLIIRGNLAGTFRQSTYVLPHALEQATSFNPTAPVYAEGADAEKYGGYFEFNYYKVFNPVALIALPDLNADYQNIFANLSTELKLTQSLSANFQYGQESDKWENNVYFPTTSLYVNQGRSTKGYAQKDAFGSNNRNLNIGLDFQEEWDKLNISAFAYYRYQEMERVGLSAGARNFLTDVFTYNNLGAASDFQRGYGMINSSKTRHEIEGYYGGVSVDVEQLFYLNASLNHEGSSWLGANSKRGLFYGFDGGVNITPSLRLRGAFNKTGNLPTQGTLSQAIYDRRYNYYHYNGNFSRPVGKVQEANPELQWEETNSWEIGADFQLLDGKLIGTFDYYRYRSTDLILHKQEFQSGAGYVDRYINEGIISGSGLEFSIQYQFVQKKDVRWDMGIVGTRFFRTILEDYGFEDADEYMLLGRLGGICPFPVFRLEEGQPIGQIWGLRLDHDNPVNSNGSWNFIDVDVDGDGRLDQVNDKDILGNALPKFALGINNQISWKAFSLNFQLRGVFGHDMVNHLQSFNSAPALISTFNILESGYTELAGLTDMPDFSDRDVQDASYLRLTYLTLNCHLNLPQLKGANDLELFVSAQNLFTITGYTGLDPEYRMEDRRNQYYGYTPAPYVDSGDARVQGMERVDTYPNSRIFSLGVNIRL